MTPNLPPKGSLIFGFKIFTYTLVLFAALFLSWKYFGNEQNKSSDRQIVPGTSKYWVSSQTLKLAQSKELPWNETGAGWQPLPSALHALEVLRVPLPRAPGTGGAIEVAGDSVIISSAQGHLFRLEQDGTVHEFQVAVPLNIDALSKSKFAASRRFKRNYVRVVDLLLIPATDGARLLAAHIAYVDECTVLRISAVDLGDDLSPKGEFSTLFSTNPCVGPVPESENANNSWFGEHSGGRMIPDGPGAILFSVGDFGLNGVDAGRRLEGSDYGRILRIDLQTGASQEFTQGHRNPQGLLRSSDGTIWQTEHGPQGGDELNRLREGLHYGFPIVTLGTNYGDKPWPSNPVQGRHEGYQKPVFAWSPSIGISNLVEADATQFPNWQGDLLVGSLKARSIFRLRIEDGAVLYSEPLRVGERIRDIATSSDGKVIILTDSNGLIFLRNKERPLGSDWSMASKVAAESGWGASTNTAGAAAVYEDRCSGCHALWTEAGGIGPHLVNLMERPVGSVPGFDYSSAMSSADGTWTLARLRSYLQNPDTILGARMPQLWLKDAELALILSAIEAGKSGEPTR